MDKTVPITVDVNIVPSIQSSWSPKEKATVLETVQREFIVTAQDYFQEWWDIIPQCARCPKATLSLRLTENDWGEPYLQLRLIVDIKWSDGSISTRIYDLAESERWREREALAGLLIPSPSPTTAQKGLLDFMHRNFPPDWLKRRALLFKLIQYAPVAVDARWLNMPEKVLVLPFPKTDKYIPFFSRSFRVASNVRYQGGPTLIARADNQWGPYDPDFKQALTVRVIEPLDLWDPNQYNQAIVYLHDKDPLWDSYWRTPP